MKKRIKLPELKNPINSNFSTESFTGGPVCFGIYAGTSVATFLADALT